MAAPEGICKEYEHHSPSRQKTIPKQEDNNIIFFKLLVNILAIEGGTVNKAIIRIIPTTLIRITTVRAIKTKSRFFRRDTGKPITAANSSSNNKVLYC